jgi:hypothetical protein
MSHKSGVGNGARDLAAPPRLAPVFFLGVVAPPRPVWPRLPRFFFVGFFKLFADRKWKFIKKVDLKYENKN